MEQLLYTLMMLPGLIIGFTFHEYMHAKTASLLGDPTAQLEGRVSLNPIRHIDWFGFALLLVTGFGWAKAVRFDSRYLKKPDRDEMLIAIAGPAANLILAIILVLFLKINLYLTAGNYEENNVYIKILYLAIYVNIGLFLFNMIPIPPLDGSHILFKTLDLKPETEAFLYRNGMYIFIILIFIDYQTKLNLFPIGEIVAAIMHWLL